MTFLWTQEKGSWTRVSRKTKGCTGDGHPRIGRTVGGPRVLCERSVLSGSLGWDFGVTPRDNKTQIVPPTLPKQVHETVHLGFVLITCSPQPPSGHFLLPSLVPVRAPKEVECRWSGTSVIRRVPKGHDRNSVTESSKKGPVTTTQKLVDSVLKHGPGQGRVCGESSRRGNG